MKTANSGTDYAYCEKIFTNLFYIAVISKIIYLISNGEFIRKFECLQS